MIQQENFAKMVPTHTSNADFEHRISDLKPKLDKVVKLHSKVRMQVDELRVGTQARDTHMASIGHLKQEQEQEHELVRHLEVQQKGIENLKKQLLLSNNVLQRLQGKWITHGCAASTLISFLLILWPAVHQQCTYGKCFLAN